MRFTSPTLLFVVFLPNIPFVSAIPTTSPDKNKHSKAPGCPALKSTAYIFTKYYNDHLKKGDLFTSRKGIPLLKSRDSPEPENRNFNLTKYALLSLSSDLPLPLPLTRKGGEELGVKSKRTPPVVYCGTLSCIINREVSEPFGLIAGVYYDVIVDYPYVGATGGKKKKPPPQTFFFFFILSFFFPFASLSPPLSCSQNPKPPQKTPFSALTSIITFKKIIPTSYF